MSPFLAQAEIRVALETAPWKDIEQFWRSKRETVAWVAGIARRNWRTFWGISASIESAVEFLRSCGFDEHSELEIDRMIRSGCMRS
jgi:hypothetical protein